jgi:DNA-binding MarR family transcriptional regulator
MLGTLGVDLGASSSSPNVASGAPGLASPPGAPGGAPRQFLAAFDTFVQAVRRARGAPAQNDALTLSQYALLSGLDRRRGARVRDLAAYAGITPSTATRILDALERRRIVERKRTSADRRTVTIKLTPQGRRLLEEQDAWLVDRQVAFYDSLPPDEKALAPDLLARLAALIDELASGPE